MTYKSPYRLVLLAEKKKRMQKEQEIALFQMEKKRLENRLQMYEKQEMDFYGYLLEETEWKASFLNRHTDPKGKRAVEMLIARADEKIAELKRIHATIQHKIEVIEDLEKEKEKAFNKEKQKMESKKIESVMLVRKRREELENGGNLE